MNLIWGPNNNIEYKMRGIFANLLHIISVVRLGMWIAGVRPDVLAQSERVACSRKRA